MSKTVKIIQIGMTKNPGGIESFIMNIYRNIDKNRVQFEFLVQANTDVAYEDEIKLFGGKIHKILCGRRENIVKYYYNIFKFFSENKDIKGIHFNTCCLDNIDIIIIAKLFRIPIRIVHSHNSDYIKKPSCLGKITERVNQNNIKTFATHLFACSKLAGDWMFPKSKFELVNNAIDITKFKYDNGLRNKIRCELNIKNELLIGHVGRFAEQKNHEFIIDTFYEINKKETNAILVLIGSGPLERAMKDKVIKLGLQEKVKFLGIRKDISELLQGLDIFLMPSLYEGLPVVLVEAQAAGLPCVISDVITREVQLIKDIRFVSLNKSAKEWANEVLDIKSERIDTSSEIYNRGYDIKSVAKQLEEIYLEDL